MPRTTLLIAALSALCLSACASTPTPNTLFAGIDQSALPKSGAVIPVRKATDDVCKTFYKNTQTYLADASQPSGTTRFLTQIGVGLIAGVAGQGIGSGISSTAGRIAVQSAASSAVFAGSEVAMKKLTASKPDDAKIIAMAQQIGCPVQVT